MGTAVFEAQMAGSKSCVDCVERHSGGTLLPKYSVRRCIVLSLLYRRCFFVTILTGVVGVQ